MDLAFCNFFCNDITILKSFLHMFVSGVLYFFNYYPHGKYFWRFLKPHWRIYIFTKMYTTKGIYYVLQGCHLTTAISIKVLIEHWTFCFLSIKVLLINLSFYSYNFSYSKQSKIDNQVIISKNLYQYFVANVAFRK